MDSEEYKRAESRINFLFILCFTFLVLKLGQFGLVAKWSWWWVFSPIWIPLGIGVLIIILGLIILSITNKNK